MGTGSAGEAVKFTADDNTFDGQSNRGRIDDVTHASTKNNGHYYYIIKS